MTPFKVHMSLPARLDAMDPAALADLVRQAFRDDRGQFRIELPVDVEIMARGHQPGSDMLPFIGPITETITREVIAAHGLRHKLVPFPPATFSLQVTASWPLSLVLEFKARP